MSQILYSNGIGVPRIKILAGNGDTPGTPLLDTALPFCHVRGHKESWEEKSIIHEVISPDISNPTSKLLKKVFGYYAHWTLNWNNLPLTVNDQQNIARVYNLQNGNTIWFTPRSDYTNSDGTFEVIIVSINLDIIRMPGTKPAGNDGFILELKTKNMMPAINIRTPLPIIEPNLTTAGGTGTPMEGGV